MRRFFLYAGSFLVACGALLRGDTVVASVRSRAVSLLNRYVPSGPGDTRFLEIVKDFGGKGTTCGFLPPWLFWRLGCRVPRLVNRNEPQDGLMYADGDNISRIRWQPEFRLYRSGGALPRPGDTYFVSDGPPATEHVGVVLGIGADGVWTCAEAGQRDDAGRQCARIVERRLEGGRLRRVDGLAPARLLVGWLDLDAVMSAAGPADAPLGSWVIPS